MAKASFVEVFKATVVHEPGTPDWKKRISIDAKAYYQDKINKLKLGSTVWLTIDDRKPKRTDAQNRLYWVYLHYIQEETGNDAEALHEMFKAQFSPFTVHLVPQYVEKDGKWIAKGKIEQRVPKSTTDMTKAEFAEYILAIEELTGFPIPDTAQYLYHDLKEYFDQKKEKLEYPESTGDVTAF